jgi:hypothetical protein
MENVLLETLGLTRDEFQKGLVEFYQKKHLEELPNQKPLLERMIEQSGKGYFVGKESKLPQWYDEYVLQLLNLKQIND